MRGICPLNIHTETQANRQALFENGKTPSWGIFFRQDCVDWT